MSPAYRITFAGWLAVELMEFDYAGKHYSYHGKKLDNAVKRLTAEGGPQHDTPLPELYILANATRSWLEAEARNANS